MNTNQNPHLQPAVSALEELIRSLDAENPQRAIERLRWEVFTLYSLMWGEVAFRKPAIPEGLEDASVFMYLLLRETIQTAHTDPERLAARLVHDVYGMWGAKGRSCLPDLATDAVFSAVQSVLAEAQMDWETRLHLLNHLSRLLNCFDCRTVIASHKRLEKKACP